MLDPNRLRDVINGLTYRPWMRAVSIFLLAGMCEMTAQTSGLSSLLAASKDSKKVDRTSTITQEETRSSLPSDADRQAELRSLEGPWKDFEALLSNYKVQDPSKALDLIQQYISRWPQSPVLDSVRLIAAQCAMATNQPALAYQFCTQIKDATVKLDVLELRLQLLAQMGRYEEIKTLFQQEPVDQLPSLSKAMCEYYMAEAYYKPLQLDFSKLAKVSVTPEALSPSISDSLKQALKYYTASAAVGNSLALSGAAECAQWLGSDYSVAADIRANMNQMASKAYLQAAESSSNDVGRLIYLAALSLKSTRADQALDLAKKAFTKEGSWKGASALLALQLYAELGKFKALVEEQELAASAIAYDPLHAFSLQAGAYSKLGNTQGQIKSLEGLLKASFEHPIQDKAMIKTSFKELLALLQQNAQLSDFEKYNELYGKQLGRDEFYFDNNFLLGSLYEAKNELDPALKAYSRIVVQAPTHKRIGESLLHKGLLEAKLQKLPQSWSTLDLYLREHGSEEGLKAAWPTYLQVSLTLRDYEHSKQFNDLRFDGVLDKLASTAIASDQKQEWMYQLANGLDLEKKYAETVRLLTRVQARQSALMNPQSSLLLCSSQAQIDEDFQTYFAKAHELFDKTQGSDLAEVQLAYANRLDLFKKQFPQLAAKFEAQAETVLESVFDADPKSLSAERLLTLFHSLRSRLQTPKSPEPWNIYFPEQMYRPDLTEFAAAELSSRNKVAMQRLVRVADQIKACKAPVDESFCLNLALIAWLAQDLESSKNWVPKEAMKSQEEEAHRLALVCALSQMAGDSDLYWEAGQKLLDQMQAQAAPSELTLNFEMAMARQAALRAKKLADATTSRLGSSKAKSLAPSASTSWQKRALELFASVDQKRQAKTEPLHLEAAIERAQLLAWSPKGENLDELDRALLEVKLRYEESSEGLETYRQEMLAQEASARLYQAYLVLIDAMRIQDGKWMTNASIEDVKLKLEISRTLYTSLQKNNYLVSVYLGKRVEEGLQQIDQLEKGVEIAYKR